MSDGNFTKLKRWLIGLSGVWVAVCSVILTKQGVGISGELAWMGTAIAIALFCAELMFNSNFEELNWTILALGLGAYLYSIWTNVEGFYFYRDITGNLFSNFDVTNFGGGLFMDIYPELAIAWAMKESKIGDLFGNFIKTLRNPDKLTEPMRKPQPAPSYKSQQSQAQPNQSHRPQNNPQSQRPQQERPQQQVPKPRPTEDVPAFLKNREEPTYHPMSRPMTSYQVNGENDHHSRPTSGKSEREQAEAKERASVNWRGMTPDEVFRKDEEITSKYMTRYDA